MRHYFLQLALSAFSFQSEALFTPEMATIPITKCTSNEQTADMRSTDEKNGEKSDKKLTVLESHGYVLGKTIGAGSYATVKVKSPFFNHKCRKYVLKTSYRHIKKIRYLSFLYIITITHKTYPT